MAQKEKWRISLWPLHSYRGIRLTDKGEQMASAWCGDIASGKSSGRMWLEIPWDAAHDIAGQLEHAAPELVNRAWPIILAARALPAWRGYPRPERAVAEHVQSPSP
jgi:Mn-dependent DtxR family transcriptional regulator